MSDTQQIKDKIDIVDLIGEYVQLKPAGVNHKGLCPFHHEKSPSFMVNRDRQSWHCFGCSKGGDIFSFVQEMEGMDFVESLKYLANRAGVEVQFGPGEEKRSERNRVKEINEIAVRFYHSFLLDMPASREAREYLDRRGLTRETIDAWQIGFASEQWDLLTQYLLKKGFGLEELVLSGLTIKREGANMQTGRGFYDRFRGRVMFPINDVHSYPVGFTGRVLVETETSGGKYVNTPQTPAYDKSRVVFGLDKAKQAIREKDVVVMVEGQMDVIACHQAGMKNVVATSGTALTEEQIKLLKRYTQNLKIAFDADAAGQAAAKRGIDLAIEAGMNVSVIQIPEGKGKDPDECLKKNPEVWFLAVDHAKDVIAWYIDGAFLGKDIHNPKVKQEIANRVIPEIARIPFAIERDHWLRDVANRLQVDASILREEIDRLPRKKAGISSSISSGGQESPRGTHLETQEDVWIERMLVLLIRFPQTAPKVFEMLPVDWLDNSLYFPLYEAIKMRYTAIGTISLDSQADEVLRQPYELLLMKSALDAYAIEEDQVMGEMTAILFRIRERITRVRRQSLGEQIRIAEAEGHTERVRELFQQLQSLS